MKDDNVKFWLSLIFMMYYQIFMTVIILLKNITKLVFHTLTTNTYELIIGFLLTLYNFLSNLNSKLEI